MPGYCQTVIFYTNNPNELTTWKITIFTVPNFILYPIRTTTKDWKHLTPGSIWRRIPTIDSKYDNLSMYSAGSLLFDIHNLIYMYLMESHLRRGEKRKQFCTDYNTMLMVLPYERATMNWWMMSKIVIMMTENRTTKLLWTKKYSFFLFIHSVRSCRGIFASP